MIVTAPGKQLPVALHADYLHHHGVGVGRHQIVFCVKGGKTFQTLPYAAIPDNLIPAGVDQFVELLGCTPTTHPGLLWTESRLEEGQVLYMPPNTFHRVKSDVVGTVTLMVAFDNISLPSSPRDHRVAIEWAPSSTGATMCHISFAVRHI